MESFVDKHYLAIFLLFVIAIIVLSFYLGYQEGSRGTTSKNKDIVFSCPSDLLDKQKISLIKTQDQKSEIINEKNQGIFVGSKNGTKYYTPGCSATNRIKPENLIWFQSIEDATLQGYSKGSC